MMTFASGLFGIPRANLTLPCKCQLPNCTQRIRSPRALRWWRCRRVPPPVARRGPGVDLQICTRDHRCVVRGQEDGGFGVVRRAGESAKRYAGNAQTEEASSPWTRVARPPERDTPLRGTRHALRGVGGRRGETVDADAELRQFHRRRPREVERPLLPVQYPMFHGSPWCPAVEMMLMMLPRRPWSIIDWPTCFVHKKVPVRMMAICRVHSPSGMSRTPFVLKTTAPFTRKGTALLGMALPLMLSSTDIRASDRVRHRPGTCRGSRLAFDNRST